jgi:hypothetical protein
LDTSPGQMRHVEPSLSSTIWLLSCCLICIDRSPNDCSALNLIQRSYLSEGPRRRSIFS